MEDFGFRGDNYIRDKNVRVVSLACNKPTGPPLDFYQILSYYLKQYGSYGLHEISASGEITTSGRKWELSLLHGTCLLFISTKHYQTRQSVQWATYTPDQGYRQFLRKNVADVRGDWTRDLLVSSWTAHPTEPPRPASFIHHKSKINQIDSFSSILHHFLQLVYLDKKKKKMRKDLFLKTELFWWSWLLKFFKQNWLIIYYNRSLGQQL